MVIEIYWLPECGQLNCFAFFRCEVENGSRFFFGFKSCNAVEHNTVESIKIEEITSKPFYDKFTSGILSILRIIFERKLKEFTHEQPSMVFDNVQID